MTFIDKQLEKRLLEYYRAYRLAEKHKSGPLKGPDWRKSSNPDPDQSWQYIKLRSFEEKKLPDHLNIKVVLDQFCQYLYRNKYEYNHMPRARKISFRPKNGEFIYLAYNDKGWFHFGAFAGGFSIDFYVEDIDDFLRKLLRFRLIAAIGTK